MEVEDEVQQGRKSETVDGVEAERQKRVGLREREWAYAADIRQMGEGGKGIGKRFCRNQGGDNISETRDKDIDRKRGGEDIHTA